MSLPLQLLKNKLVNVLNEIGNENNQLNAIYEEQEARKSKIQTLEDQRLELETGIMILSKKEETNNG